MSFVADEAKLSTRQVCPSFTIHCTDPALAAARLAERCAICREAGCFNMVWEMETVGKHKQWGRPKNGDMIKFQFAGLRTSKFTITLSKSDSIGPKTTFASRAHAGQNHKLSFDKCLTEDSQAFEDVFMTVHHVMSGPCVLKTGNASTPMSRLDKLEAQFEHLQQLMLAPDKHPDEMSDEAPDAKRRKLEDSKQ
jgi:hypothetical protein